MDMLIRNAMLFDTIKSAFAKQTYVSCATGVPMSQVHRKLGTIICKGYLSDKYRPDRNNVNVETRKFMIVLRFPVVTLRCITYTICFSDHTIRLMKNS